MAKQLIPDVARFDLVHRFDDGVTQRQWATAVYLQNEAVGWSAIHLASSAQAVADAWEANVVPALNADVTFLRVDYNDQGADPGISGFVNVDTPGTATGDSLPLGVVLVVTLFGDSGQLPSRGRWMLSGWSESDQDGGVWLSAFLSARNSDIADFIAAANDGVSGDAVVIVSRAAGTPAQLATVRAARADLEAAIAATKRDEGVANTLGATTHALRARVGSMRERNQPNAFT